MCKGGVSITDEIHSFNAFYETYKAEPVADGDVLTDDQFSSNARFFGAVDIIVTGEVCLCYIRSDMTFSNGRRHQTSLERQPAWGAFKYIGRIRPSDGLVILLREPVRTLSPSIFLLG